ncbi:MAG TPA: competence/damage-inducible protein A [bacterium]|nr:competence/damage-inducible protein A [bacterium]
MKAEIISVGTELLLGQIANTNAQYLGVELATLGVSLHHITTVGDNKVRLKAALDTAWKRADIIILTGGLGPTQDDITKETLAEFLGLELILDAPSLAAIQCSFAKRGRHMTDNNIKQALMPKGSMVLPNPNGTAPGVWLKYQGKAAAILPGPPFELQPMFTNHVLPRLTALLGDKRTIIKSRILKFYGIGESQAEEDVKDLVTNINPTLASYATPTGIQFRLTANAVSLAEADNRLQTLEDKLLERLGRYFFARDEDTMQDVVGKLLSERNLTLAVAESCTGGLAADWLTNVPGSSTYFRGGIVSYSNQLKTSLLHVPEELIIQHGAVSSEVAEAMARGVKKIVPADIGAATTGIAGPGGGSLEKPVGLVYVAVANCLGTQSRCYQWSGSREIIKQRTAQAMLDLIRQTVLERETS